jgi:hypothetical protein
VAVFFCGLKHMAKKDTPQNSDEVQVAVMANDIQYIKKSIDEINAKLNGDFYVTKNEFDPVKKVVYGLVGMTLVAVLGAVLGFFIMK